MSEHRCRIYTPDQEQFLRENYSGRNLSELTALFNNRFCADKTCRQIRSFVHNRGITSGRTGRFDKGHKPWNADSNGKKLTGANARSFKKGNAPPNRKPLWSERISTKGGYVEMKVPEQNPYTGTPTRYKMKQVWVWEQAYGPIPKGFLVAFKDGDNQNCDIENLMLLNREELLIMNQHGYKNQPAELKPSVLVLSKLEAKAGIRTRPSRGRELGEF